MTDTDRLAELAATATPGPWTPDAWGGWAFGAPNDGGSRLFDADCANEHDAAFIVALVNAYRDGSLVDDNRELRAALTALLDRGYPDRDRHHMMVPLREPDGRKVNVWADARAALHREDGA